MDSESQVYVFAYGSNLHTRRMRTRVSTAVPVGIGYVAGHQLRFHKSSDDGSAKADAAYTASPTDRIWGVVYRMWQQEKPDLDKHESLGIGYDEKLVSVNGENGTIEAWIYVARRNAINKTLKPYGWYFDFVLIGAQQHRLPFCYIRDLKGFESTADPDFKRRTKNRQLIET